MTTQVEQSPRYGNDRITGILHVTDAEAYFDYRDGRIVLVSAAPMTAVAAETLVMQTAGHLQGMNASRVRAQGDLQGNILWGALVSPMK